MFAWKQFLQHDGYRPAEVEHSALTRLLTLLTVSVAIMATILVTEGRGSLALSAIGLSAIGSWVSWHRREARNWWIKLILALLMLLALANFLYEIGDQYYDPRIPLANLLIWLQVLHSFDLPRRKDIFYSLWVGLILISVAATTSRDNTFGGFLLVYAIFSTASLIASHLSSHQLSQRVPSRRWLGFSGGGIVLILGAASLVYLALPRYDGLKIQTFPVSPQLENLPSLFRGEIKNPAYQGGTNPDGSPRSGRQHQPFDPYAYYGFSTELDLNYRGELADHVVMRVRTHLPSYWRGMAFDTYDGLSWRMSRPYELTRKSSRRIPIWIRESNSLEKNIVPRERVTQTFYIEYDQSNLIFKAPYAEFIYFPADYVMLDSYGGLRSPIELFKNTTYTVVSEVPRFSDQRLREVSWEQIKNQRVEAPYYTLPENLPPRVAELTRQITAQAGNPFDAVKALDRYLQQQFPYDLKIPEFPENRDTVDYFLFEQQAGYCEHFASSLAVMARQLGLATRFVTGYTSGDYNPLTGYFEVRGNDAHGWVEVYFPHHGWVPFDPTPGSGMALTPPSVNEDSGLKQIGSYFGELLPAGLRNILSQIWQGLGQGLATVFGFGIAVLTFLPLSTLLLLIVSLIALTLTVVFWRARRAPSRQETGNFVPRYATEPERQAYVQRYLQVLALARQQGGLAADADQTPLEQSARLSSAWPTEAQARWEELTGLYYEIRYAQHPLDAKQLMTAHAALKQAEQELRQAALTAE